jgi:hypothetical protein
LYEQLKRISDTMAQMKDADRSRGLETIYGFLGMGFE